MRNYQRPIFWISCLIGALLGIVISMTAHDAWGQEFMPPPTKGLLMIHNPLCGYCQAFLRDTDNGENYNQTDIGKVYPLVILNLSKDGVRQWLRERTRGGGGIGRIKGTPTFIFWKNANEIGRVVGYSGIVGWWSQIEQEYEKIE